MKKQSIRKRSNEQADASEPHDTHPAEDAYVEQVEDTIAKLAKEIERLKRTIREAYACRSHNQCRDVLAQEF